ncbi:MAG: C45 family autoproteolytic acyltransferase/hydrolase [Patescibacteria group bacterium]|nr:C45 family autoproteolytic acyltransferase/hydrolase [Patescibacteria group bacterium]MDD5490820.1 C45 family autoproteolytic acyltransferase/hydrolase [Patescibacteria group bacterium]
MRFIKIKAKNNYEAGFLLGKKLGKLTSGYLEIQKPQDISWEKLIKLSKPYLAVTQKTFPQFIKEMKGLAKGSGVPFLKIWALNCVEEILQKQKEKCTSIFIPQKNSYLVGHNEDWERPAVPHLTFLLQKTIGGLTIWELAYLYSIGGNACSINSFGLTQSINTLHHLDSQVGVPKNIVARWLSEFPNIKEVKKEFGKIRRASGYSHTFTENAKLLNIESTAKRFAILETQNQYCHTNNFTGRLKKFETRGLGKSGSTTYKRYASACRFIKKIGAEREFKKILSGQDKYAKSLIYNPRTLASVIINPQTKTLEVKGRGERWLKINLNLKNRS